MAANTVEDTDALKVEPKDLVGGGPVVHVEGVEEEKPGGEEHRVQEQENEPSKDSGSKQPIIHEGENVTTTYTVEDQASMKDKVKGKLINIGDKLRPKDATHAKNADPHPNLV